jgi:hypothetical protein
MGNLQIRSVIPQVLPRLLSQESASEGVLLASPIHSEATRISAIH